MRERNNLVARYSELAHSPDGPLSTEVARVLATGDPRFGLPALGTMLARNLNEVRDWLRPQLEHNAIEIALVGDLDKETAIAAVAKTLGALPRRDPWPPASAVRGVRFPPHPFTLRYDISSATAEGRAMVYWPTTDGFDAGRDRRLGLLASVLRECLRERVRESLGLSYSPEAESRTSRIFPEYGYMEAAIAGNPAQVAQIADIAVALGAALARDGVTKDQLDRARRPALTAAREALCSNGYWLNEVLACAQAKPIVLEQARAMLSDLENCRPADLSELAATYLVPARASRVTLLPGGPSASEVAASSAPRAGRP
jgi:zinc protease